MLLFVLCICWANILFAQTKAFSTEELEFHWSLAESFFLQKDYYRSISELNRLKFYYHQRSLALDKFLAKNYYLIRDYNKLIKLGNKQIAQNKNIEILGLTSLAYLQLNNLNNAQFYWKTAKIKDNFYTSKNIELLDPEKALLLSIVPGLGFAYSKNYILAFASFLLNTSLIYYTIEAWEAEQYAISYLTFFFEYQFYLGGMRGAKEQAEKYNQEILTKEKKIFIRLFEKKFGVNNESKF